MGYSTPPRTTGSGSTGATGYPRANGLNEFYSRVTKNENIELFVDKGGNPTTGYPHVHIVHHQSGQVDIVASVSEGNHVWRTTLQRPTGSEVETAVGMARSKI
jgi:hypothetical protein